MTAVLNEKTTSSRSIILQEGWRVFFMAAGIYAVVALGVWLVWAGGLADLPFAPAPIAWHAHEMVFGFAFAAIAGFFLTAVPNWTGARPASGRVITLLAGLWLAGRVAVWFAMVLPGWLVALVDLTFLPVLAATMLAQLLVRPKPQNLMFLGLLTLAGVANLLVHLDWMRLAGTEAQGIRGGLLTVCAMIAILGGRVTPAFTRNALLRVNPGAAVPVSRPRIDMAGIVLALLTALLATADVPAALTGAVAVVAGLAALLRLSGWRALDTLRDPIVWTMHASYLFLGLGLLGWGLSLLGLGSEIAGLHLLGVGAVGGMTLSIMSRASLGHSGRPIRASAPLIWGYVLLPVAAGLRWAASTWPEMFHFVGTVGAGALWVLAFALFLVALWPVWTTPRARGGAR
ncbi:NnrS family protein [Paracoccus sp. SJTW-4]|uniref:NnrS family protein n=1 Tax=Paracoccus sp. SJTW-4 TaxID=3078428 RepID=UPI0039ED2043